MSGFCGLGRIPYPTGIANRILIYMGDMGNTYAFSLIRVGGQPEILFIALPAMLYSKRTAVRNKT